MCIVRNVYRYRVHGIGGTNVVLLAFKGHFNESKGMFVSEVASWELQEQQREKMMFGYTCTFIVRL